MAVQLQLHTQMGSAGSARRVPVDAIFLIGRFRPASASAWPVDEEEGKRRGGHYVMGEVVLIGVRPAYEACSLGLTDST
jgi:hypothetical protein